MKSLKEMTFKEIKVKYADTFANLLDKCFFENIANSYEKKINEMLNWIDEGLKIKGTPFGRDHKSYGLTIIYGWFLEKIFLHVLLKNQTIKSVTFFGDDAEHKMKKVQKIEISGKKTTKPDFKVHLKNGIEFFIELKSAAKEKFTIKKGNVNALLESSIRYDKPTLLIMLDLKNQKYEIKDFNYFVKENPKPNNSMEGQLCYDFPVPSKKIEAIINENFDSYVKNEEYKKSSEYQKREIKVKAEKTEFNKLVKQKLKLEDLEKQRNLIESKISDLKNKNKDIDCSWELINQKINKNQ